MVHNKKARSGVLASYRKGLLSQSWVAVGLLIYACLMSLSCSALSCIGSQDEAAPIFQIEYNLGGPVGIVEIITIYSEGRIDLLAPNLRHYRIGLKAADKFVLLSALRSSDFEKALVDSLARGDPTYNLEYIILPLLDEELRIPVGDISDGLLDVLEIVDDIATEKNPHYIPIAERVRAWKG